jgi:DNA polymerase III delta subunit
VKFFDFLDKQPAIGKLVVVEGTERALAERAMDVLLDRLLPAEVRDLNLSRFGPDDLGDMARVREAVQAMPFLADRRVVVVSEAQTLRADPRRALFALTEEVPEGNTLLVSDLLSPRSTRPQSLGSLAGRAALRIDTTADEQARARFVTETLERLQATAEPRAIAELARSEADLTTVRNDLEKLALAGKKITLADLERETLTIGDPKAYKFASALVEGNVATALQIAHELFAENRGAAVALFSALAAESGYLWEAARPSGQIPERMRWRERTLRPLGRRIGARRARIAFEGALAGIEAVVTGRAGNDPEDHKTLVDRISVGLAEFLRR